MKLSLARGMKTAIWGLGTWVVAVFLMVPPLEAQIPRTGDGRPDFSGTWTRLRGTTPEGRQNVGFTGAAAAGAEQRGLEDFIPFQPWAREKFLATMPWDDPQAQGCIPRGAVRYTTTTIFLTDFVQTPEMLYMLFNQHANWRRIYLDGRDHPEDVTLYFGHSVGALGRRYVGRGHRRGAREHLAELW